MKNIEPDGCYSSEVGFYYSQGFLKDIIREAPPGIMNMKIIVKYVYNDLTYIYVTRNPEFSWPPKKVPGFNPKITKATYIHVEDKEGLSEYLTNYIKSYAGPFNDFHGETLTLDDIDIDDAIIITNHMNESFEIKVHQQFNRKKLWVYDSKEA
jgi:hypothetical protein